MELDIKKLDAFDCILEDWHPRTAADAWVDVTLGIGVLGEDGLNWFNVTVASVAAASARGETRSRKGLLVSSLATNGARIRELLNEVVQQCAGRDWDTSVDRLRQRFDWEYDDYQSDG